MKIPGRVKFEFEIKEGAFVPDRLSAHTVYNRKALERRYPNLNLTSLENSIDRKARKEIMIKLREYRFIENDSDSDPIL